MTVSAVGTLQNNVTAGATTLAITPTTIGNCFLLVVKVTSATITVSSVADSNTLCTWSQLYAVTDATNGKRDEIWMGTVSATGSTTITVTFSASTSGLSTDLAAQEFTNGTGASTTWSKSAGGANTSATASTAVTMPSLTGTAAGQIYFGYVWIGGTGTAGSTSGYTYDSLSTGNFVNFNPNCSASAQAPTMTQTSANWYSIAVMVQATVTYHQRPVVLSQAVQRAAFR